MKGMGLAATLVFAAVLCAAADCTSRVVDVGCSGSMRPTLSCGN